MPHPPTSIAASTRDLRRAPLKSLVPLGARPDIGPASAADRWRRGENRAAVRLWRLSLGGRLREVRGCRLPPLQEAARANQMPAFSRVPGRRSAWAARRFSSLAPRSMQAASNAAASLLHSPARHRLHANRSPAHAMSWKPAREEIDSRLRTVLGPHQKTRILEGPKFLPQPNSRAGSLSSTCPP